MSAPDETYRETYLKSLAKTLQCSVCHTGLPNAHLMDLHMCESHDSFFQAQAQRGMPVYECLVEFCGEKFSSVDARRKHLEHTHRFFPQMMGLDHGIGLDTMHKPMLSSCTLSKKKCHSGTKTMRRKKTVEQQVLGSDPMEGLSSEIERTLTIEDTTRSISFGRRKGKGI